MQGTLATYSGIPLNSVSFHSFNQLLGLSMIGSYRLRLPCKQLSMLQQTKHAPPHGGHNTVMQCSHVPSKQKQNVHSSAYVLPVAPY